VRNWRGQSTRIGDGRLATPAGPVHGVHLARPAMVLGVSSLLDADGRVRNPPWRLDGPTDDSGDGEAGGGRRPAQRSAAPRGSDHGAATTGPRQRGSDYQRVLGSDCQRAQAESAGGAETVAAMNDGPRNLAAGVCVSRAGWSNCVKRRLRAVIGRARRLHANHWHGGGGLGWPRRAALAAWAGAEQRPRGCSAPRTHGCACRALAAVRSAIFSEDASHPAHAAPSSAFLRPQCSPRRQTACAPA
jgi:hypothetical protein